MTLSEGDDGLTILDYVAVPLIKGRLAAIGQRFIKASADQLSKQFFARFTRQLGAVEGAVRPRRSWTRQIAIVAGPLIGAAGLVLFVLSRLD